MFRLSVRNICSYYIYLYALVYQLLVVLFKSQRESGAMWQIQVYQCSVLGVLFLFHYLNRDKTRKVVNLWFWLCLSFLFLFLIHICAYVDSEDLNIETSTFIRIFMWLYFGYVMTQVREDPAFVRYFMMFFWIGTLFFAIETLTYSSFGEAEHDVYRNAGDAVAGSTVNEGGFNKGTILSVALNIILSFYWLVTEKYKSIKFGRLICLFSIIVCSYAIIKSYQRAIQFGLFIGFFYALYWSLTRMKMKLFLFLLLVLMFTFSVLVYSESNYMSRWNNVTTDEGSGRKTFFSYAIEIYTQRMSFDQQIVGAGYAKLVRTIGMFMHGRIMYGIHTHSDLFDMLVCYGAVGIVLFFCILYSFFSFSRGVPMTEPECLVMRSSFLVYLVSFFTTGVFSAIYSMIALIMFYYYCISCCQHRMNAERMV